MPSLRAHEAVADTPDRSPPEASATDPRRKSFVPASTAATAARNPERVGTAHRDDAAQGLGSPQRRLRSADQLDAAKAVGSKSLEPRFVVGGDVVECDAVDEDEGMARLRTPDANLRLRALRARSRYRNTRRQTNEIGREGRAQRFDGRRIDHGDRGRGLRLQDRHERAGNDDLPVGGRPAGFRTDLGGGEKKKVDHSTLLRRRHSCVASEVPRGARPRSATHRWLVPAGRGRRRRQVSWLAGRCPIPQLEGRGSPLTVAGTAPVSHRLPIFTAV